MITWSSWAWYARDRFPTRQISTHCCQITTLALVALVILGVALDPSIIMARCCYFIGPILWAFCIFFIRASVVHLYLCLFTLPQSFRIACYVVLVLNTFFVISIVTATITLCQPLERMWDPSIAGRCGNKKLFDLLTAIVNLCLDLAVVLLPMPILWGLQMALKRKVILTLIFGMGIAWVEVSFGLLTPPAKVFITLASL